MADKKAAQKNSKGSSKTMGKAVNKIFEVRGIAPINKSIVSAFIVGLAVGLVIMLMFMPDRIATLENGEEVIVTLGDKNITANDLY